MSEASNKAYEEIKQRIQNGSFQPGDRLVERTLCTELEMSRTPVREALRILTAEGWLTNRPRRGMIVSQISEQEVGELFEFGMVLEAFMASLAAKKASASGVKSLKKLLKSMSAVLSSGKPNRSAYVELDREFHALIATLAGNRRLATMLQSSMNAYVLHQAFSRYSTEEMHLSLQQHKTIVDAIERGDSEWAASAMRTHILSGRANSRFVSLAVN